MKRCAFFFALASLLIVASCDEGFKPAGVAGVQENLHPESGDEKLKDAKLGFFFENDYSSPLFSPFKTDAQYAQIAQAEHAKFLHVAADTANTIDLVTALAEYEDISLWEKLRSTVDLRYQMIYVNTFPSDARYSSISVESSNPSVLNPIMVNPKTWFLEICNKGSADLTMTVSSRDTAIRLVYPFAAIAEVPLKFNTDNVWIVGDGVPIQVLSFQYAFPKLPKGINNLAFLATVRAKLFREVSYRNEPVFGNKWFTVVDTVEIPEHSFVESLDSEKEKKFMVVRGDRFNPYYKWDRFYEEYFDSTKNEKVRYLVEQKVPYEITGVRLYFDAVPFDRFIDMDGSVGSTNFVTLNFDDPFVRDHSVVINNFISDDYAYVKMYYEAMGDLWKPQVQEDGFLELLFNEFLTDSQIDQLLNATRESYYSHGWSSSQIDSIFNANRQYIEDRKR